MTEQGSLGSGWARPELVAALSQCVAEWERALAVPVLEKNQALLALIGRSRGLEAPSRSVGFGGVGHHLNELSRLVESGAGVVAAREQLGVVRELLATARASLTKDELARAQSAPPASLQPPPLLSSFGKAEGPTGPAHFASAPPPLSVPPGAVLVPPRLLTSVGQKVSAPPPAVFSGAPPAAGERPLPISPSAAPPAAAPPPPLQPSQPPLQDAPPAAPLGGHAPLPATPGKPGQPNLMVRSVLGLRAFGSKNKTPAPKAGSSLPPLSPADPSAPAPVLGLQRRSGASAQPPPALGGGYGGLPPLREPSHKGSGPLDVLGQLERSSSPSAQAAQRTPPGVMASVARGRNKYGGAKRRRTESGEQRWWVGALAALGVCIVVLGIVLVAVMVTRRHNDSAAAVVPPTGGSAAPGGSVTAAAPPGSGLPRSRLLTDDERFRSLLSQVHGRGGKESAELRALLDDQAATASQALLPGCVGPHCKAMAEVGKLVTATDKKRVKRRSRSPDALRSRWLAGLEMPEIPVEDDPRVQKRFEFYTENPLGRETFQQMLFRCGAYKDAIQSSLIRHGLPKDLIAVAYAESGCYPLAKSPAGAEGLWQFMPDAARAYHLRIIEGVVDERHSPQKATEAAIQYFSDMYAKFGSWDLVFASYNMGPFGLAARLERVEGEDVGFWELVDAQMLPGETADYAPAIQAIALILNNLQRLKFGGIQQRAPQMTMDLAVPPGTRLSLIARAAGLSLDELRRLNLDIQGTSTPNVQNFAVQVPKDSVWQARDMLQELLRTKDESDLCAPQNFDWGRQRFTPEMQQACARSLGARAAAAAAATSSPAPDAPQPP